VGPPGLNQGPPDYEPYNFFIRIILIDWAYAKNEEKKRFIVLMFVPHLKKCP
jgi:hypothetical protein